ncbi:MAG: flagellar assembly protein FliW [Armatimonadetes bacterium]|nr:flagellar assembly protein FliW [Armatimonadota bacterium]
MNIENESVLTLPDGLLGFDHLTRYVVLSDNDKSAFRWLQSLEDPAVAFLLIDPWCFRPDYGPEIRNEDVAALGIRPESAKIVYAIVTIPPGQPEAMTANLLGPIVINVSAQTGRQVIVDNCEYYTTKHSILTEMRRATGLQATVH